MSKLPMERHLTQMPCDFVDMLKAKGKKIFLVKYRTQTSSRRRTKQPLQPACNIVRLQSLLNDKEAQATLNFIDAVFLIKYVTTHHWIEVNKKTLILFQIQ